MDKGSERRVLSQINELLKGSRKAGKVIVKDLSRRASNSAARLTIPATPSGAKGVRRPKMDEKFRPVVGSVPGQNGRFYVVNKAKRGGKKRKFKKSRQTGFNGTKGESRAMRAAGGQLVIYTTKKVSQKNRDFTRVKKLIKAWDKKTRKWRYIPTLEAGNKYDRKNFQGQIPFYFTAKQCWLWTAQPINRGVKKLNRNWARKVKKYSSHQNRLFNLDNPSYAMTNRSNYAHKRGGSLVPRRALQKALRGYKETLKKQRDKIVAKAKAKGA